MTLTAEGRHRELVSLLKGITDELRWAREDTEAQAPDECNWDGCCDSHPVDTPSPRVDELARALALADDRFETRGNPDGDPLDAYRNLAETALKNIATTDGYYWALRDLEEAEARSVLAEEQRDEWRAKALKAEDDRAGWEHEADTLAQRVLEAAPLADFQWESCGDNRHGQPTGRWIGPIHVDHNQETPE